MAKYSTFQSERLNGRTVIATGLVYFIIVFSFAFGLGVARSLLIAPQIGETAAVIFEVLILLLASQIVARRFVHKWPFSLVQLVLIGAIAFVSTMVSEAGLAGVIRDQSLDQWVNTLTTPLGLVGLAGQIGFALMPILTSNKVRIELPP